MAQARHDSVVIVSGFDPGGAGNFGCSILDANTRKFETYSVSSVDEALDWLCSRVGSQHMACGIDSCLHWQSTPSGWRGADEYLKSRYPAAARSIFSTNSAYGAMAVQGAILATKIRQKWPNLLLTETHPKILYFHYVKNLYPVAAKDNWPEQKNRFQDLFKIFELVGDFKTDNEFDAAFSAWAALQAQTGKWDSNLIDKVADKQKVENFFFTEPVTYFWPSDDV